MKVHELVTMLGKFNQEFDIVVAGDEEGNSYSPLADMSEGMYEPESSWCGDFYLDDGESDSVYKANAVCLWPVN